MQSHYDVIILGDSLAGRIAAVLLARGGCRVLSIEENLPISPVWFTSCLHLEKLLDSLSGRSCLTASPSFQILTPSSRVDFSGRHPLDEELLREFPEDGEALTELLATLRRFGEQLEIILYNSGRIPLKGLGGGLGFRWKALRGGLGLKPGTTKLSDHLKKLPLAEESHAFLKALFTGLSLTDFETLSYAEAALIWSSHSREHGASASGLDTLLRQRYEQFHGKTEALENFRQIDATNNQIKQIVLKNGSICTANHYLIATADSLNRLTPAINPQKINLATSPTRIVTSELQGELSPLLSRRVILSDTEVLRLSFGKRGENTLCAIDLTAGRNLPDENQLRKALTPAFAFTQFELELPSNNPAQPSTTTRSWIGQQTTTRLQSNAYLCDGTSVLPGLGSTGETLLGCALATSLLSRRSKKETKS